MKTYRVEIESSALADIDEFTDWIRDNMPRIGGDRYLDAMISGNFYLLLSNTNCTNLTN